MSIGKYLNRVAITFAASLFLIAPTTASAVDSISIAINEAPWLPGFEALTQEYTEQTGVRVDLRVFPFGQLNERSRSAVTANQSEFDIITMTELGTTFFYAGDLIMPFEELEPNFELDPNILHYNYLTHWDEEVNFGTESGTVRALPINGNIQLFFYRADLYENAGLPAPETWNDVMEAARQIGNPETGFFGYANRGQRGAGSISFDFYPFLTGMGGDIFADPPNDWAVILDSPEALAALELYLELAREYSPPNVASIGQAEQIALLASGQLLQTIVVAGAFADMDDLERSIVPDQVQYAVVPRPENGTHATNTGVLMQGIPRNLPEDRQRAALAFLTWVTGYDAQMSFARGGGVPVRSDVYESELADEPEFRYFQAMAESTPYIVNRDRIPEALQYEDVLERRLNEALIGQTAPADALRLAAQEIYELMREAGYDTEVR